jgi:NitT/TauT family transport system substrate-binding protein
MNLRRFAPAAAALALLLIGGACPLRAQTPVTVRVAAPPFDNTGPVYYAQDLGYFKDVGLSVEFAAGLNNAAAALAALSGGSVDFSAAAITSIAAAHDAGVNVKIIAASQQSTDQSPSEVLMVRKDSVAKSAVDFNGKTIGIIGLKSLMQVAAMSWADRHGGDSKTLKFIEVPVPQMCSQLEAGRIDAMIIFEPFASGCPSARVVGNVDDGIAPRFLTVAFVGLDDWLTGHRDIAARFASAISKAAAWANTHPRESAAILVKYAHLDPTIVATMKRASYAADATPSLVQPVIDASARYGSIPRAFPVSEILLSH